MREISNISTDKIENKKFDFFPRTIQRLLCCANAVGHFAVVTGVKPFLSSHRRKPVRLLVLSAPRNGLQVPACVGQAGISRTKERP